MQAIIKTWVYTGMPLAKLALIAGVDRNLDNPNDKLDGRYRRTYVSWRWKLLRKRWYYRPFATQRCAQVFHLISFNFILLVTAKCCLTPSIIDDIIFMYSYSYHYGRLRRYFGGILSIGLLGDQLRWDILNNWKCQLDNGSRLFRFQCVKWSYGLIINIMQIQSHETGYQVACNTVGILAAGLLPPERLGNRDI